MTDVLLIGTALDAHVSRSRLAATRLEAGAPSWVIRVPTGDRPTPALAHEPATRTGWLPATGWSTPTRVIVSAERDELRQLVEDLPDAEVPAAVAELRLRTARSADRAWPPPWFGAASAARTDTAARCADGNGTSCPSRSATWSSTTNHCATTSAGQPSTAGPTEPPRVSVLA